MSAVDMGIGRMKRHSFSIIWLPPLEASFPYRSIHLLNLMFTVILSKADGAISTIPDSQLKELVQRGKVTCAVHAASWCPRPLALCEDPSSPWS